MHFLSVLQRGQKLAPPPTPPPQSLSVSQPFCLLTEQDGFTQILPTQANQGVGNGVKFGILSTAQSSSVMQDNFSHLAPPQCNAS